MIATTPIRKAPTGALCAVCRSRLADRTPRVVLTVDAETQTTITSLAHERCAVRVVEFTRARGYTPADLSAIWEGQ